MTETSPLLADPWLEPYRHALIARRARYAQRGAELTGHAGSLSDFANGHLFFGVHPCPGGHVYREWAPGAAALALVGDFNGWSPERHPLRRGDAGVWEVFIPHADGLGHLARFKVKVTSAARGDEDRLPLYARYVVQDPATLDFAAVLWEPPTPFAWSDQSFAVGPRRGRLIYEAHVGMATEDGSVGSYLAFAEKVLPRIRALGYDTLQLMAILEHPYYASFGYHVTNFFAPSSRFGTPDELKLLIDEAHRLGLAVLLDVVHSHAARNVREGLNGFDGTLQQFFHEGARGVHPAWDSLLFAYGKPGVAHFLLSNLKYWLDEFHFDGFRFDGVTSMLYQHHGLGVAFDHLDRYFDASVDEDALVYLQLANTLVHTLKPAAITIAEDVSGMPGMALPVAEHGLGFDYRLAMGLPDYWVRLVATTRDEDWSMGGLWHALNNRRAGEAHVAYVESHDQSLVGDKTLMFRLADAGMYDGMGDGVPDLAVERALALVKLARALTLVIGGEAYLNFMGNEFGHPEWVDFPRAGNGWSGAYARRQWSLADDPTLRYRLLEAFDRELLAVARRTGVLAAPPAEALLIDEERKVIAAQRGLLILAANLHPTASYPDVGLKKGAHPPYYALLDSDAAAYGGHGRIDEGTLYGQPELTVYLPSRTLLILAPVAAQAF